MVIYEVSNNIVIARFESSDWASSYMAHYKKHINVSPAKLNDIISRVIHNLRKSGMKFYGEAKCSPEDAFNEKTGTRLAKKRLLAKYNRVLSMLDEELLKVLQNDIDFINRYKIEHKERGKHV